ncbi:DUF3862 domain-containing protein [Ferrimonas gelatinilytica]|uniref:Outer membrane protein assembly factor BamE n=1 Tax=Ferrimonas gelatinilytica TaxID=1255257 RepID=A0ABP9S082_9GAMM
MKQQWMVALVAAAGVLSGCSKVTAENYAKLDVGMERQEVEQLLGKPDQCEAALGAKSCIWGDEKRHIKVAFAGDTAMLFSSKGAL